MMVLTGGRLKLIQILLIALSSPIVMATPSSGTIYSIGTVGPVGTGPLTNVSVTAIGGVTGTNTGVATVGIATGTGTVTGVATGTLVGVGTSTTTGVATGNVVGSGSTTSVTPSVCTSADLTRDTGIGARLNHFHPIEGIFSVKLPIRHNWAADGAIVTKLNAFTLDNPLLGHFSKASPAFPRQRDFNFASAKTLSAGNPLYFILLAARASRTASHTRGISRNFEFPSATEARWKSELMKYPTSSQVAIYGETKLRCRDGKWHPYEQSLKGAIESREGAAYVKTTEIDVTARVEFQGALAMSPSHNFREDYVWIINGTGKMFERINLNRYDETFEYQNVVVGTELMALMGDHNGIDIIPPSKLDGTWFIQTTRQPTSAQSEEEVAFDGRGKITLSSYQDPSSSPLYTNFSQQLSHINRHYVATHSSHSRKQSGQFAIAYNAEEDNLKGTFPSAKRSSRVRNSSGVMGFEASVLARRNAARGFLNTRTYRADTPYYYFYMPYAYLPQVRRTIKPNIYVERELANGTKQFAGFELFATDAIRYFYHRVTGSFYIWNRCNMLAEIDTLIATIARDQIQNWIPITNNPAPTTVEGGLYVPPGYCGR